MYKLTRRNVIAMVPSSAVVLCPALLNAQAVDPGWGEIPTDAPVGQDRVIDLPAGPASVDISDLEPGALAVIARPSTDPEYTSTGMTQYIGVLHRTPEQIAFGAANDRAGAVQDPAYLVVNLVCTHRGKAIGFTGDADQPFACTDRGRRHSSNYNASGLGVAGASEGEYLSIPTYTLTKGDTVILALA